MSGAATTVMEIVRTQTECDVTPYTYLNGAGFEHCMFCSFLGLVCVESAMPSFAHLCVAQVALKNARCHSASKFVSVLVILIQKQHPFGSRPGKEGVVPHVTTVTRNFKAIGNQCRDASILFLVSVLHILQCFTFHIHLICVLCRLYLGVHSCVFVSFASASARNTHFCNPWKHGIDHVARVFATQPVPPHDDRNPRLSQPMVSLTLPHDVDLYDLDPRPAQPMMSCTLPRDVGQYPESVQAAITRCRSQQPLETGLHFPRTLDRGRRTLGQNSNALAR